MGIRRGKRFRVDAIWEGQSDFQEGMYVSVLKLCHKSIRRRNALFKQVHSPSEVGDVRLVSLRGQHPSGCRVRKDV